MQLQTERLKLMELSPAELEDIHQLHLLPAIDEFNTLGIPGTLDVTSALVTDWLFQQSASPRMSYIFCIKLSDSNQFVGLIALSLGKLNFKMAEVWYKIHPAFWRQGYASEALEKLLAFGFSTLCLHRIEAGCAVENIASIKVLEKVGMKREGVKRKILPIRGAWVDNYSYAILETDFKMD